ncbi:dsDNA nuclease domain-containing protein [Streptomyces achromogenes]|uniref:dsDNA nuclease domain-containing protein n=1 Tax=Streptomyces achromogenes TaxID=67255 RepID=UPI0036F811E5
MPWEVLHEPAEDSGSETADRYEYQYQVVARHCCDLGIGDLLWILCEWHTDYILAFSGGRYALVSVKHRELSQGHWTLRRLCDDGGLATLYARWRECRKPYQTRLATNAALDRDSARLAKACAEREMTTLRGFARDLWENLECATEEEALEFLASLRIEHELPPRKYIRAHNIENHVRPMLARTQGQRFDGPTVYDAIVDVVRQAARAVNNDQGHAWVLSTSGGLDSSTLLEEDLRKRLIDKERISARLQQIPFTGPALLQSDTQRDSAGESRLAKKLRRGGIGETGIHSARRTRRSWATFAAQYSAPLPHEDDLVDDLTTRVLHEAGLAEADAWSETSYGRKMLSLLNERLRPETIGVPHEVHVDRLHLLGLVYQLTDECKVWWSPEFDVDADGEEAS